MLGSFLVLDRKAVRISLPLIKCTLTLGLDSWVVSVNDRFQYGQKNKNGDGRWLVLHNKDNKMYQVSSQTNLCQGYSLMLVASLYGCDYARSCC